MGRGTPRGLIDEERVTEYDLRSDLSVCCFAEDLDAVPAGGSQLLPKSDDIDVASL